MKQWANTGYYKKRQPTRNMRLKVYMELVDGEYIKATCRIIVYNAFIIRGVNLVLNRNTNQVEKKLKAIQHRMEGYEDEVIRVIDGTSKFSDEMLARLIARTEAELQQEKQNYEELCRGLQTKETVSDIRTYYRDFLGWANEFDCASLPRKRAILSQLLDSVEVGRGYKIIIHMNVNYEQFLHPDTQEEFCTADICAGG